MNVKHFSWNEFGWEDFIISLRSNILDIKTEWIIVFFFVDSQEVILDSPGTDSPEILKRFCRYSFINFRCHVTKKRILGMYEVILNSHEMNFLLWSKTV